MISSIAIAITGALLVLGILVAVTSRRRGRSQHLFELGTVSQQWLVGHKGDER